MNSTSLSVLTSSFVLLLSVSTDGLRLPRIQTYIAENFFIILIFTVPFLIINEYEFCNVGHLASVKNTVLQY